MKLNKELKEKINKALGSERYMGREKYSEDEYREMVEYARQISRSKYFNEGNIALQDKKIVFITLVEIAKHWKNTSDFKGGGSFWEYIYSVLQTERSHYSGYRAVIDSLYKDKKILMADRYQKYYATVMMHAFAPHKSMTAFFDLLWNVFKKDLRCSYVSEDEDVCAMVARQFCGKIEGSGVNEKVQIGSRAYIVQIGIRSMALGRETAADFVRLLHELFADIHKLYYSEEIPVEDYLKNQLIEWWRTNHSEEDKHGKEGVKEKVASAHAIKAEFIKEGNRVYLYVPAIRFSQEEYPQLKLSVFAQDDKTPMFSDDIWTEKGELTLTSVPIKKDIDFLLKTCAKIDLRISITNHDKVIFSDRIQREFILFEDKKEIRKNTLPTQNYFVYSLNFHELQSPKQRWTVSGKLYNIYPLDGEMLCGEERSVVFVSEDSPNNSWVTLYGYSGCKWRYNGLEYNVYNRAFLRVSGDLVNATSEIRINGRRIVLTELSEYNENEDIVCSLTHIVPAGKAITLVFFSNDKERELLKENIIIIPKLKIEFDEPYYYGTESHLTLIAENQHRKLHGKIGQEKIIDPLYGGVIEIEVPLFRWCIDNKEWHYSAQTGVIWYKYFIWDGSTLFVQAPQEVKLLCKSKKTETSEYIPKNDRGYFSVGKYVYGKEGKDILSFFAECAGNTKELFVVSTKEYFSDTPLIIDEGKLRFVGDKYFVGEKREHFNIRFEHFKETWEKKSDELRDGIISGLEENFYNVTISAPRKIGRDIVLWEEKDFVFGDADKIKLSNVLLKINPVYGIQSDYWKKVKYGYYINELERITGGDNCFYATMYCEDKNGERGKVTGFSRCIIEEILSKETLRLAVLSADGKKEKLTCDEKGEVLFPPESGNKKFTNFHFIEVRKWKSK